MHQKCDTSSKESQARPTPDASKSADAGGAGAGARLPHGPAVPLRRTGETLQAAWITLLSRYHWDLFGTLTFREDTHPESAYKRFRLFLSMINRKLYGPRWHKHSKGVAYCIAIERQYRGVLHFHVLLADPELGNLLKGSWFKQADGRWANELNEMWNELAGFARIEPIKALELVKNYVSKYVIKGGEIDLGGPLIQRRLEQAAAGSDATVSQRGARGLVVNSGSVPPTFSFPTGRGARSGGLILGAHEHSANGGAAISLECAPVPA